LTVGDTRTLSLGAFSDAAEQSMVMTDTRYQGGGPVVLIIPGVAGFGWDYKPDPPSHAAWWAGFTMLAHAGAVVCAATLAGPSSAGGSSWGNPVGLAEMDAALAYLEAAYDADLSRVALIGDSEGGVQALNYLWRNPTDVAAVVTRLAPVSVQPLYESNPLVTTTVDVAFAATGGWAANQPTHDPSHANNLALVAPLADKVRCYYSTNDGLAPAADHLAYAAGTGVEVVSVGAVAHDIQTTGVVDPQDQALWIWSRLARVAA
jgi:pimeloyl-ACP methyl ester carboxylesterase